MLTVHEPTVTAGNDDAKGLAGTVQPVERPVTGPPFCITLAPATQIRLTLNVSPELKIAAGLPVDATSISHADPLIVTLLLTSRDWFAEGSSASRQTDVALWPRPAVAVT